MAYGGPSGRPRPARLGPGADATHTFDRRLPDGTVVAADDVARATAASLHDEFATVVTTADALAAR